MHAIRPEVATANPTAATWLIAGYVPSATAAGVINSAMAGARPYPMVPYMGLLHETLSVELADFIAGKEDAATAMADVEAAYNASAQQAGFLN